MIGVFQRYVLHNFGLKFLSLLLASGLWFLISPDEQPAEVAVRAPIVFQHVPAQLEISPNSFPRRKFAYADRSGSSGNYRRMRFTRKLNWLVSSRANARSN